MLAKYPCQLWVHFFIEDLFMQTHSVSFFTEIHSIFLHDLTSEKEDTMCWLIYFVGCGYIW